MAFRDSLGRAVVKALNLPVGAVTQTEQQIMAQVPASGATAEPMERRAEDYMVPFAPGRPLVPALINPPREDGRTAPRRYEFPVAWNLQVVEQRVVPFKLLRDVADGSDLVRKCIEIVKASISGMSWDIAPLPTAVERLLAENPDVGSAGASRAAREMLAEDITRCRDFWIMPDRINGLSFPEWVAMAVEEMLVIDALSIYPNKTLDEENLHSLEILDGATIKPLLDDRGSRPIPPHPAFQQILWGFPRGEFTASADADGEFTVDDLIYAPRTRRPFTPYGYSAVERALPMIDLYMKRLQWLRTEFTDGVTPQMMVTTDATYGGNPEILRAYERVFNDELSGKTENRMRMRLLPDGMTPVFPPGMDEKYKPDFDEYLLKQVCSHFGVLPTQLGFAPKGGLGGKGVQEGEQLNAEIIGLRPIILWMTDLVNQLSYRFLNMPKDLGFIFTTDESEDALQEAQRRQVQLQSGEKTLNEVRGEVGLPLFTFPEADMPMVPSNVVPLASVEELISGGPITDEGGVPGITDSLPVEPETEGETGTPTVTRSVDQVSIELDAFRKWCKGSRKRSFMFEFVDTSNGAALNALAKADPDAARNLALMLKNVSHETKAEDSFTPPKGVQTAAQRALDWLKEGHAGSGFTDVGRKRASDLARGAAVSAETIGRMVNYFGRHEGDRDAEGFNAGEDGFPSPGRVAWDAWGGDAGRTWAQSVYSRLNPEKAVNGGRVGEMAGEAAGPPIDRYLPTAFARFAWTRERSPVSA